MLPKLLKRCQSIKSKTSFLKTVTKKLGFLKRQLLFNETLGKRRFIVSHKQNNGKIPDPCNSKAHYHSFMRNKNTRSVKKSKNSYLTTKSF